MVLLDEIEMESVKIKIYFHSYFGGQLYSYKILPFSREDQPLNNLVVEYTTMDAVNEYLKKF